MDSLDDLVKETLEQQQSNAAKEVAAKSGSDSRNSNNNNKSYMFNFPFPPYDIQVALMKVAYETFEKSKFALLESPTGTGKSLSLICSSLTWLRGYQQRERQALEEAKEKLTLKIEQLDKEEEESGDWLKVQTKRQGVSDELSTINKQLERLNRFNERNQARQHARLHGVPLENYMALSANNSDPNKSFNGPLNETRDTNILGGDVCPSSQTSNVSEMAPQDGEDMEKKVAQLDEDQIKPKIYYASRTHSQLSQFINEVKRTQFANPDSTDQPPIKVAALASRANLCVNPEVLKLKESSAINERCMEMQKETKSEKRCPYIKAKEVNQLKDDILSSVYDIEDLVSRGRTKGACPYYASRMAIPEAELIVLPYNNLLHRETRMASSLDLKDNIVILDEAHNILETICSIHSAPITGLQLVGCHSILSRYYKKYSSRMSPRNATIVKIIVQCLTALIRYLNNPRKHIKDYESPKAIELEDGDDPVAVNSAGKHILSGEGKLCKLALKHEEFMIDIAKFAGASNIERFNVFKIVDYLNRSQLARKLLGFFRQDSSLDLSLELHENIDENKKDQPAKDDADLKSPKKKRKKTMTNVEKLRAQTPSKVPPSLRWQYTSLSFLAKSTAPNMDNSQEEKRSQIIQSYPVYTLMEFLRSLTNLHDDGKILTDFYDQDVYRSSLKFLLLNPSSQFKHMVKEARSIVLAGGTMQPFEEFLQLLFGPLGVDERRITLFSCGHVISHEKLFMASLSYGPTNKQLELSYKVRNSFDTIDELGRTIMNISFIVPGGMVCFLPSYEYEQICFTRWTKIGIISKIEIRSKHVFREPRQAGHMKPIFDEYSKRIESGRTNGRGSLLFCVVGGKMSEGINFNDDLGRCVVMIGLPYANIKSGELLEKMKYYDKTCKSADCPNPGQRYYENLCLKGINQSIGRAVRHINDYAAVVLLDHRYQTKTSVKGGLPKWMCQSLTEYEKFGTMFNQLRVFYNRIRGKQS
uniref:Putative ATP-dependent RNA helicase DDX11-like protein 8 n=1 Tax=Aceria tosichella TaxID=561515 RepID=A0A6G1S6L6_9ACAR